MNYLFLLFLNAQQVNIYIFVLTNLKNTKIMKTKITILPLLAILYLLPVSAQEKYLPIFEKNKNIFYLHESGGAVDSSPCEEVYVIVASRNNENTLLYDATVHNIYWMDYPMTDPWMPGYLVNNSWEYYFPQFKVNEDNSKLWGIRNDKEYLLMDLNLQVGDNIDYPALTEGTLTVTKVYESNGRKVIEFDKKIPHVWDYDGYYCTGDRDAYQVREDIPVQFIEGVGCNFGANSYLYIYAKGEQENINYKIPAMYCSYCACHEYYSDVFLNTNNPKVKTLSITPNPSDDKVQITLPEAITGEASLTVSDLSGKIIETLTVNANSFVLDISRYTPAAYIAKINMNGYQYAGKIIKK
jgi:hypothetical protein